MEPLRWRDVRSYLAESEGALLAELSRAHSILHKPVPGEWSVAQIVHHLVRTEQIMFLIWAVIPKFRRFPRWVEAANTCNATLWRLMGMRTIESAEGKITTVNATEGRFQAPVFLRPSRGLKTYDELIEWRRCTRDRSMRAIASVDEETLNTLRWSHPLLGSSTLMEFAQFLGIHERHHLPQIQRIREADGPASS